MEQASAQLEFERAARLRDQLSSIERVEERQTMVGPRDEDLDLLWLVDNELEASVQVFHVRRGRVVGRKGFVVDKVEDLDPPSLVGRLLEQCYAGAPAAEVPPLILSMMPLGRRRDAAIEAEDDADEVARAAKEAEEDALEADEAAGE